MKDQTEEAYTLLITLIKKLNWDIALPTGGGPEDDRNVHGMIIGEQSYIDYILKHLE
jgi:hypothetical protein